MKKIKKLKPRVRKKNKQWWSRFSPKAMIISLVFLLLIALPVTVYILQKQSESRSHAAGPELFVSPTGSGDCSQASPCTLTAADAKATPGTTIIAASGSYKGPFATTKGGATGQFITYKSQEKHGATITSNGEGSSMSIVELKNEYVRFQDFTITGAQARHGFHLDANNVEVIGNHIHTLVQWKTGSTGWKGGAGIQTGNPQMSGLVIDGNIIHHIGAPGSTEQLVHGMYIDSHVTNSRVSNNVIYNVEDFGLHPYPEAESSGWLFINNTIVNTGRGILQAPNGVTRNNIVFNTRGAAYVIRGSGNVVSNNIAGGTGSGGSVDGVTSGVDPMFVNAASNDFHIKPGSPAIDKGLAEGAPPNDADGKARPIGAGIDLGAYEVGDGPVVSAAPSSGAPVPTYVCAGSGQGSVCPTITIGTQPSVIAPTQGVVIPDQPSIVPTEQPDEEETPEEPNPNPSILVPDTNGNNGSFLDIILKFFAMLLALLLSLFQR